MRYLALFPFSSSRPLLLSGYILSYLSMIAGSRVGGLTYLHLHLYPHMTNPTDHCYFPYLTNFMTAVAGLAHTNSPFLLPIHYRFLVIYLVAFL
jgi:hypothetical protein